MSAVKVSLVVPCYNEEKNVAAFHQAVTAAFDGQIDTYEIIFINDGSKDATWKALKQLYAVDKHIKLLNFSRNFGKEAAMYAGLQKASGEYVTLIDADLQQPPALVPEMVQFLEENDQFDSVAMFQQNRNEGHVLSFFKTCFYRIINALCDIDFRQDASDFRTFRRTVALSVLEMKEYFRFSKGIFSWIGFETHYMPYTAQKRHAGKTSWSFKKLLKYAIEGITAFSTVPLKISAYIGGICSTFSLLYMLVVIIQKLFFGIDVPGYATLLVMILLIGGIQLVVLGIIGQYLSKVYIESKHRPLFIEKEYLNNENE